MSSRLARIRTVRWLVAVVLAVGAGCRVDAPVAAVVDASTADAADAGDVGDAAGWSAQVLGPGVGAGVTLSADAGEDDTIVVQVRIVDVPDLYGLACHLRFDPTAVEIVGAKEHPVLAGDGYLPRTLVKVVPGRVLLGGARVRASGSAWSTAVGAAVGNQLWATLTLRRKGSAATELTFDPERCLARSADYTPLALRWDGLRLVPGGSR